MKMKLTVAFEDSTGDRREVSGTYGWLETLARLEHCRQLPNFKGFSIVEA